MSPNWGDKYSILLIAGDEESHVICNKTFEHFNDILLLQENNPFEGRMIAGLSHPDLVITDVEFPDQDRKTSEGLYRAMRLICPLTRFLVYSYVQEEQVVGRYLSTLGAECYLFKPISIDLLLRKTFASIDKPIPDWLQEKLL